MRKLLLIIVVATTLLVTDVFGQAGWPEVEMAGNQRGVLPFAWAGGMNACQYGAVDINMDGQKDLVVFDRCGNRILPFIASGSGYSYAPAYSGYFPDLVEWAVFTDYDGDGKEDIFTYSPGYASMMVYRNTSGSQLEFTLEVFPYLTSFQGGGYVNILVTYADYPAISDLDGDGDLDILTFYGLGSFVDMHRNMSMEKYGNRDSLDFMKTESCWGRFAESEESNQITLDTCGDKGTGGKEDGGIRHTGSTMLTLDLNGDGWLDLLLGDVDYPNVVALYNGGGEIAQMTSYEWQFPSNDLPVDLFSMPASFYADVNFDGRNDLLFSPFDPNPEIVNNINSSWLYVNIGGINDPTFQLQDERFLQRDMMDFGAGAYPVFYDYDQDGLADMFAGNFGRYDTSYYDQNLILHSGHTGQIALFRNTGSLDQPAFEFITDDFASTSTRETKGITPAFADLDGDGDADMVTGREDGTLDRYENTAPVGSPMQMVFTEGNYKGIDVGAGSSPVFFDLNNDDLVDLVIGEKGGNLNYYRNTGNKDIPEFELATDSLGKVNVTDYTTSLSGYSTPCFAFDQAGHLQLMVGSEQGKIFYYADIEDDLTGEFKETENPGTLLGISGFDPDRGYRSAPFLLDINVDGILDLVAGNFCGGLEFFSEKSSPQVDNIDETLDYASAVKLYPNPSTGKFFVDFDLPFEYLLDDIYLFDLSGKEISVRASREIAQLSIDCGPIVDGIYYLSIVLKMRDGNNCISIHKKVLKKSNYK